MGDARSARDSDVRELCDTLSDMVWEAREESDKLRADIQRMKPVVDTAVAYSDIPRNASADRGYTALVVAVEQYKKSQPSVAAGGKESGG